MALLVGLQAADNHQKQGALKLVRIEGAFLQRPHAALHLSKVQVLPVLCQLIVPGDGFKRRLPSFLVVGINPGHQLLQGVRADAAAVRNGRFQLIGTLVIAVRGVVGRCLLRGDILKVAGAAVGCRHVGQLLRPVGVKNLPALSVFHKLYLIIQLLSRQVLVHEAPSVHIQVEESRVAHDSHAG